MDCIYNGCRAFAEAQCQCQGFKMLLCNKHLAEHLEIPISHESLIFLEQDGKKVVLTYFGKFKAKAEKFRIKVLKELSEVIGIAQNCAKETLKKIRVFEMEIEEMVCNVINSKNCITRLTQIFAMSEEKAIKECKNWELTSFISKSNEMFPYLSSWCDFSFDLTPLYEIPSEPAYKISPIQKISQHKSSVFPEKNPLNISRIGHSISQKSFEEATLRCLKGHSLKWSYVVPHLYAIKSKGYYINCSLCEIQYSKPSWHCDQCDYNVCEECSDGFDIKSPQLECMNSHVLLWRSDVSMYYQQNRREHYAVCNICQISKDEDHWHCRECCYDICQECAYNAGFSPIIIPALCKENHPLIEKTSAFGCSCNKCNDFIVDIYYACTNCTYFLCEKCYKESCASIPAHPIVSCGSVLLHTIRWKNTMEFMCRFCLCKKTEECFFCEICNFAACADCSYTLILEIMSNVKILDSRGHEILWNSRHKKSFCIECKKIYQSGAFRCNICKEDICVPCSQIQRNLPQSRPLYF